MGASHSLPQPSGHRCLKAALEQVLWVTHASEPCAPAMQLACAPYRLHGMACVCQGVMGQHVHSLQRLTCCPARDLEHSCSPMTLKIGGTRTAGRAWNSADRPCQ